MSVLHLLSPLIQFMRCFRELSRTRLGSGNYSAVTGFTSLLSTLFILQSHFDLVCALSEGVNILSAGFRK